MTESKVEYTTPDEVTARLMRQEAYIQQLENTNNGLAMIIGRHAETIARLEADNKRLRHLDAMPLDAMHRYFHNVSEVEEYAESREDFAAILSFLFPPVR